MYVHGSTVNSCHAVWESQTCHGCSCRMISNVHACAICMPLGKAPTRCHDQRNLKPILVDITEMTALPDAPASLICWQNLSIPLCRIGLKYVNRTSGAFKLPDTWLTMASTWSRVVFLSRARVAAPWMTGPSARGSCTGTNKAGVRFEHNYNSSMIVRGGLSFALGHVDTHAADMACKQKARTIQVYSQMHVAHVDSLCSSVGFFTIITQQFLEYFKHR